MPTNRTNTRTPTRTFRLAICCPNVRLPGWISFCKTSKQRVCALCSQSRVVCQEKIALRKMKWRSTVKISNLSIITYKKICSAPKSSPRGQVLETALVLILHGKSPSQCKCFEHWKGSVLPLIALFWLYLTN